MLGRKQRLIFLRHPPSIFAMPTPSNNLRVGEFSLPSFALPDVVTGQSVQAETFKDANALVVIFLCRHCPYVVHVLPALHKLALEYLSRDVAFVGISANDSSTYPEDAPDKLKEMAIDKNTPFPILHDASQDVARSFQAACTPEFFVFDGHRKLFYHGRMDASTPGNNLPCTGDDLRHALECLLAGQNAPATQYPSMGCSIKWK
jgi:peroxiredoxin